MDLGRKMRRKMRRQSSLKAQEESMGGKRWGGERKEGKSTTRKCNIKRKKRRGGTSNERTIELMIQSGTTEEEGRTVKDEESGWTAREKKRATDRDKLCENICRRRGWKREKWISKRKRSRGPSQRERAGWEASGEINHQWPWCCNTEKSQWPGTKLSTHTLFLSSSPASLYFFSGKPSQRVSVLLTLLLSSSSLPLTTPYISQPFNTTLYFCSFLVSADLHGDK